MAVSHTDTNALGEQLASAIRQYRPLGVDGDGQTHYLSDDRERVAVIEGEPERSLVEEAALVQHLGPGDVWRWLVHVDEKRGWASFDTERVVELAREVD